MLQSAADCSTSKLRHAIAVRMLHRMEQELQGRLKQQMPYTFRTIGLLAMATVVSPALRFNRTQNTLHHGLQILQMPIGLSNRPPESVVICRELAQKSSILLSMIWRVSDITSINALKAKAF